MNEEDKELMEEIISNFKNHESGLVNAMSLTEMFENNPNKRIPLTRILIEDYHFIDRVGNHTYRLTKEGWAFISFAELERIENEKLLNEKIEIELAKSNLEANKLNKKIAKKNQKNEKANRIATWINVVIGIVNIGLLVWQILSSK